MKLVTKNDIYQYLQRARHTPSGGNSQPWNVKVYENSVELSIDPTRSNSFLDFKHTASTFSLGSFIENLSLAAQEDGVTLKITEDNNIDKLKINFIDDSSLSKDPLSLYIEKRHTNRQPWNFQIIEDSLINQLFTLVQISPNEIGLRLISSEEEKNKVSEILSQVDTFRLLIDKTRQDMANELILPPQTNENTFQGIHFSTLEAPPNIERLLSLLYNTPGLVNELPREVISAMTKPIIINSSHICCLYLKKNASKSSLIHAGRIMQRLWLKATSLNLSIHPWTVASFLWIGNNSSEAKDLGVGISLELLRLEKRFRQIMKIKKKFTPIFIFRLSSSVPPTAVSQKISVSQFTKET